MRLCRVINTNLWGTFCFETTTCFLATSRLEGVYSWVNRQSELKSELNVCIQGKEQWQKAVQGAVNWDALRLTYQIEFDIVFNSKTPNAMHVAM